MEFMNRRSIHGIGNLSIFFCLSCALLLAAASPGAAAKPDQAREVLAARAEAAPQTPAQGGGTEGGGFPPGLRLFFMTGPDNAPIVRALPDINGDGVGEVLVGIDESGVDNIFALDGASSGAATVVWSLQTADGASGGSPYGDQCLEVVSDTDGSGFPNILAGTAWGGRTAYSLDSLDGAIQWRFDTYDTIDSGWVYSLAEIEDVTGDGVPEAAFAVGSMNDSVYLVDGASSEPPFQGDLSQATMVWQYAAADGVLSVRNMGDAGGDGIDDLIAAVGDFGEAFVAIDGAGGRRLWDYPTGGPTAYAVGVLPDITGDAIDEVLGVLWTTDGSAVRCLDGATGAELWASTAVNDFGVMVDLLADVTGDGVPEVIASSFDNAVTVLDGATGALVWETLVGTLNGGDVWTARAIPDLDGDGAEDVIAGSFDYHVYALSGATGDVLWAFNTGNRVFSVYPVDDLDGNGRPDVAAGTQDTNSNIVVHVLEGTGGLVVFTDGFEGGDTSAWSAAVGL